MTRGRPRRTPLPHNWRYEYPIGGDAEYISFSFSMEQIGIDVVPIQLQQRFISLEPSLDPEHIRSTWRTRWFPEKLWPYPIIVRYKGKLFIRDGHHRMYCAQVMRKQKTTLVMLIDLDAQP